MSFQIALTGLLFFASGSGQPGQSSASCVLPHATAKACLLADYVTALAAMQRSLETTPRDTSRTLARLSRELAAQRVTAAGAKAKFDTYHESSDTTVRRVAAYADSLFKYVVTRGDSIAKAPGHLSPLQGLQLEDATRRDFYFMLNSIEEPIAELLGSPYRGPARMDSSSVASISRMLDDTFGRATIRPSIWAWHAQRLRRALTPNALSR